MKLAVGMSVWLCFALPVQSQKDDGSANSKDKQTLPPDVTVSVTPWPYSRVYPLLDGLFQDVSATQVKSLVLDPNAANGTNLDALQQVFQVQAQYSATAGIQNTVAAQQASAASATALVQAQLITQQSQLIQSQLIAQNEVNIAQKTVDTLTSNGASASELAAAKLQLQLATDSLNSITAQLSDVKGQLSQVPTPSFSAPSPSLPTTPPTLPSGLTGPSNVASGFSPNFPATKQMDNQMTLLWERLARLVYTLNQTADPHNYYLVQIDTGIVPVKRKHKMLVTHYSLSCGQVVDIYPRTSAVNIINEKYRESRLGLGAVISFFSWGANASYNRDHLRITQMLSQSSYITGYGVGSKDFGWAYGLTLGEDTISPGTRGTFVLVRADCQDASLKLVSADWVKHIPPTNFEQTKQQLESQTVLGSWKLGSSQDPPVGPSPVDSVTAISYTPVEDDFSNATPPAVTVAVTLADNVEIDPETTIIADGLLVNRIRDTFGRAVTGAGGSGGVLEVAATQLQLNSWIPVNSHEFILNLNPRSFRGHFPTVVMQSPRGVTRLRAQNAIVQLQGRYCEECKKSLPPLSYPKVPISTVTTGRWTYWSDPAVPPEEHNVHYGNQPSRIVINAITAKSPVASQGSTASAPLQVIDDADANPWGTNPQVLLFQQPDDGSVLRLDCQPYGPQLVCPSVRMVHFGDTAVECSLKKPCLYSDKAYQVDVIDGDHSGGAFHGRGVLAPCGSQLHYICSQPLIWRMETPAWSSADGGWKFDVSMINVSAGERAQLNHQAECAGTSSGPCHDLNPTFGECSDDQTVCKARFILRKDLLPLYQDTMDLKVYPATDSPAPIRPIKIGGLRSQLNPILTFISTDSTQMTGTNLVFDQLTVGVSGKPFTMACSRPTDCTVKYPSGTPKGYLYFVALAEQGEGGLIPVVLQQAQGVAKVLYAPSEKPVPATEEKPQAVPAAKPKVPLSSSTD